MNFTNIIIDKSLYNLLSFIDNLLIMNNNYKITVYSNDINYFINKLSFIQNKFVNNVNCLSYDNTNYKETDCIIYDNPDYTHKELKKNMIFYCNKKKVSKLFYFTYINYEFIQSIDKIQIMLYSAYKIKYITKDNYNTIIDSKNSIISCNKMVLEIKEYSEKTNNIYHVISSIKSLNKHNCFFYYLIVHKIDYLKYIPDIYKKIYKIYE